MILQDFQDTILQLNAQEIIGHISINRASLKLMFINLDVNRGNTDLANQILVLLSTMQLDDQTEGSEEIQFLFKELGFYFKRANILASVMNCSNHIGENIFKNRLRAWMHHRQYRDAESHCRLFGKYLEKLSSAITDGVEDYENDVLRDLYTYHVQTAALLEGKGKIAALHTFEELFEDPDLLQQYPILEIYQQNRQQFTAEIAIEDEVKKIYEPSIFTEALFNNKFLDYLRNHPRTEWHEILLGYDQYTVRKKIINFGQAHFDDLYGHLTSNDIVKLYCYFNMRKHYYSSLYLFDRFNHIARFHGTNGRIKFIDVGCGPATSGIALVDHLYSDSAELVSFDYFGVDYYGSMREEAEYMMQNSAYNDQGTTFYLADLAELGYELLDNANSIYINTCYLFASDSLNENKLAEDVMHIRKSKPDVPCYLLFQNSTDPAKNVKYNNFKRLLRYVEPPIFSTTARVSYNNRRSSMFGPTHEDVYFEILELT
ncbi:class I SAM-dependent methyltransferase [Chryseobacterium mulctrae]|uniref:class I SAM-dependent methyltransferase n=1 Tax=Chryseobacterium mulctrae TaxID=2576777 RepID=UPI001117A5FA|nr:hypothetical protein [Chryseobacterium mulctrae]